MMLCPTHTHTHTHTHHTCLAPHAFAHSLRSLTHLTTAFTLAPLGECGTICGDYKTWSLNSEFTKQISSSVSVLHPHAPSVIRASTVVPHDALSHTHTPYVLSSSRVCSLAPLAHPPHYSGPKRARSALTLARSSKGLRPRSPRTACSRSRTCSRPEKRAASPTHPLLRGRR